MVDITPLIPKGAQIITSYGSGGFIIGGQKYNLSVMIFSDQTVPWQIKNVTDISIDDFSQIISNKESIELLLFGSGAKTTFLSDEISKALKSAGILVETMDTGAACRTYNVLLSEGRKVAAALVAV